MKEKQYFEALTEVTARTRDVAGKTVRETLDSNFQRMRIRVPAVRAAAKKPYSFYQLPPREVIGIWDYIWKNTEWYEVAHQALYYYQHKRITKLEFSKIKTWINRCDCWEHSDDLSKIYAQVVEDNRNWIIPVFETWNRSRSLWKRRQSIVGLIEYASKRKHVLPFRQLIRFVAPLLQDNDYYVQKGIGWTLREIYNVYPAEALAFIEQNLIVLSPQAYSSATEKLAKETKQHLNSIRKDGRKKT